MGRQRGRGQVRNSPGITTPRTNRLRHSRCRGLRRAERCRCRSSGGRTPDLRLALLETLFLSRDKRSIRTRVRWRKATARAPPYRRSETKRGAGYETAPAPLLPPRFLLRLKPLETAVSPPWLLCEVEQIEQVADGGAIYGHVYAVPVVVFRVRQVVAAALGERLQVPSFSR